jgi:hypothetical protein
LTYSSRIGRGILAACFVGAIALAPQALAQGKLEARYNVTVAGIQVGKGSWLVEIGNDGQYTSAASGRVTGMMQVLTTGEGAAIARGTLGGGRLTPSTFASNITTDRYTDEVRITMQAGTVKELSVDPILPPSFDRVPVTEAHRRGVIDPMTAGMVVVSGNGDVLQPDACRHTNPVFDGRQRYDLVMSFKRMEHVKAEKGYQGPALVCAVHYEPIAGHRPGRAAIRFLRDTRDIEIWLAPITGTRVLVPFRISIPTFIGQAVLQATQFVATPQAARAGAGPNTVRAQ